MQATVFAFVLEPNQVDRFHDQLKVALPGLVEQKPLDPAIATPLAEISAVNRFLPRCLRRSRFRELSPCEPGERRRTGSQRDGSRFSFKGNSGATGRAVRTPGRHRSVPNRHPEPARRRQKRLRRAAGIVIESDLGATPSRAAPDGAARRAAGQAGRSSSCSSGLPSHGPDDRVQPVWV